MNPKRNDEPEQSKTSRVERLRVEHMKLRDEASTHRIRIETRVMRQTEGKPMVIRRAKIFAAIVREMPIRIMPDELIVGHASTRPACKDVVVDDLPVLLQGRRLPSLMVDTVEFQLTDFPRADQRELVEEIAPYWMGNGKWENSHTGCNLQALPEDLRELLILDETVFPPKQSMIYTPFFISGGHYGHNCASYPQVLEKGLRGVKEDAVAKLAALGKDDNNSRRFLEAAVMALEAAAGIGGRFAAEAMKIAKEEHDAERKSELLEIAKICARVPAEPARNFYEALQSIYLVQVLLNWESPRILSQTPGRLDICLYEYFRRDMRAGSLTLEKAQELVDCYLIKLAHVNRGTHLAVGGYRADGRDATNEISFMVIEGMKHVRLAQPMISILTHARTPNGLLVRAAELSALCTGHPIYLNADVLTTQMLGRATLGGPPVTLSLARLATPVGCYEPVIPGLDSGYLHGGYFNMAAIIELVLTNGYSRHYKKKIGPETGNPRTFATFEEFQNAFRAQLAFMMKNFSAASNVFERVLAELLPTPFESSLIGDCLERGKSREDGGARYNFKSIVGAGSTDAGDSLTAVRKLVFEEKKITMDELCLALENNFEGREDLRKLLCGAPKFGNDEDYADEQVAWVSHLFADEVTKQPNTRGGHVVPMGAPLQYYMFGGWVVGALPSGRKAGEPLSDAWSPCAGYDVNGPTAILGSMSKINNAELSAGVTLNLRFDPALFRMRDGQQRFIQFIRTFVDQGIFQVQFNMINTETLRQAQREPDKYLDLVVKVAGYSSYYTRLIKPLQDGIIARTEHQL